MTLTKARRRPPPLNERSLEDLALRYVGKYATTRHKLCNYLNRKLRERGWRGSSEVQIETVADRLAELGYIDDAAYAMSKWRSLSERGYGKHRLVANLRVSGIGDADSADARAQANSGAVVAALRFAEKRHLGPFAGTLPDARQREKWIATMIRAGHGFALARTIAFLGPGAEIDLNELDEVAKGEEN